MQLPALFSRGPVEIGPSGELVAKHTDLNAVTPMTSLLTLASKFGTIFESFGGAWQSNLVLQGRESLLAFSGVYACNALISGDVAKLPFLLKQRQGEIWVEVENSAYSPVLRKPNRYQTRQQFIEHWVLSKLIWGNTYVLKSRNTARKVDGLYIMNAAGTQPLVAPDGEVFYRFQSDELNGVNASGLTVPASEVIHDRAKCLFHPLVGVAPLYACALSGTQGNRIQANSAKFFENMSRPSGHLSAPGTIDEKDAERIKETFEKNFSGQNVGRLLVTGSDLKYTPMTMPPEQAQLIEQLRWTVEDVARAYLVPLYKIAAGQAPAFTNPAVLNLEYYQQTLQPYIEAIEALLDEALGLGSDLMIEADIAGLLRMDPKTQAEADEVGVRSGVLKPDEARARRNLPKVTGGDQVYMQQQNFSLAALAKRDAQDDPFKTAAPAPAPTPAAGEPPEEGLEEDREADKDALLHMILREAA